MRRCREGFGPSKNFGVTPNDNPTSSRESINIFSDAFCFQTELTTRIFYSHALSGSRRLINRKAYMFISYLHAHFNKFDPENNNFQHPITGTLLEGMLHYLTRS